MDHQEQGLAVQPTNSKARRVRSPAKATTSPEAAEYHLVKTRDSVRLTRPPSTRDGRQSFDLRDTIVADDRTRLREHPHGVLVMLAGHSETTAMLIPWAEVRWVELA